MSPRGRMPFGMEMGMGMGMDGLADMIAGMMGRGSGADGIHIDPEALDEYPQWVQNSVKSGDRAVKKQMSPEEIMKNIERDALKGQLKETAGMLYSTLLRVEGLKERLAEAVTEKDVLLQAHREEIVGLRTKLREERQLVNVKANAHNFRTKVVQDLRRENNELKANLVAAVEGHAELKELINSIDIGANKPDLVELIKMLKAKISGNGTDGAAETVIVDRVDPDAAKAGVAPDA